MKSSRPAPVETFRERVERLADFLNCVEHRRSLVRILRIPARARQRVDAWYREVFGLGSAGAYIGTETVLALCVLIAELEKQKEERYWCGCVRTAQWARCDGHTTLEHDEEPPAQVSETVSPPKPAYNPLEDASICDCPYCH